MKSLLLMLLKEKTIVSLSRPTDRPRDLRVTEGYFVSERKQDVILTVFLQCNIVFHGEEVPRF